MMCHSPKAQSLYFFQDAAHAGYYDSGLAFRTAPSSLEQAGPSGDKLPTSEQIVYAGSNSLRLSWTSRPGGDWQALVIAPGFPFQDITASDMLSFWVYAEQGLDKHLLPLIFMEAAPGATKSNKYSLAPFTGDIPPATWTRIVVPLSTFWNDPNQSNIDFVRTKAIIFGQDSADGQPHTLYIDEVKTFNSQQAGQAVATPAAFRATAYDSHTELRWGANTEAHLGGYQLYRRRAGSTTFERLPLIGRNDTAYQDFVGQNQEVQYFLTAVNEAGEASAPTDTLSISTHPMQEDELLDMLQAYTFRYFWEFAHPHSGLIRERSNGHNPDLVTIGGSGFGVMAILVGIERGLITRRQGLERLRNMVDFLATADRFKGAWPHWMDGRTGKVIPFSELDDGGDIVETAFMIQGLLTARQYFHLDTPEEDSLRTAITQLWEAVDWNWYRKLVEKVIYWHWSPNHGFAINLPVRGYNEALIVYLLAIASPTHAVPPSLYRDGWAGGNYVNGNTYYGYQLEVGPPKGGPLFFAHYSFLGFDPRYHRDAYTHYFRHNRYHSLVNRAHCMDNPHGFAGYSAVSWGLTASDDPFGYAAHHPNNDNGTISPTAALSSMPYTPEESLAALRHFYRELGPRLWGEMGFYDAFNLSQNWFAPSYLAIDQGPILLMTENYRSGLLWQYFMKNPEIPPAMEAVGFVPDSSVVGVQAASQAFRLQLFPNPLQHQLFIDLELSKSLAMSFKLTDLQGNTVQQLPTRVFPTGTHRLSMELSALPAGMYLLVAKGPNTRKVYKVLKYP